MKHGLKSSHLLPTTWKRGTGAENPVAAIAAGVWPPRPTYWDKKTRDQREYWKKRTYFALARASVIALFR